MSASEGGLRADIRVLMSLLRGQPRSGSHAQRLQAFYAPQAQRYDAFRERLLHGRRELISTLAQRLPDSARIVEFGAGTGRNLDYFGERASRFASVALVDLCPALLERARERAAAMPNVRIVEADATRYRGDGPVDCVYFSYALTMIPDWRAAIENAWRLLAPGGLIGCVDFHLARRAPPPGWARQAALSRHFWRTWFGHDGVRLCDEHLPALAHRFQPLIRSERSARVPYLAGLRAPYYLFVGRKPA